MNNQARIFGGLLALALIPTSVTPAFATDINVSGGSSTVQVQLTAEPAAFSVTVPTILPIDVDKNGVVTTASDISIVNKSHGVVKVTNMEIKGINGWKTVDYDSADMATEEIDTKKVAMVINNDKTIGENNITFTESNFPSMDGINSSDSDELPIVYDAKVPVQSAVLNDYDIAQVVFTVGWDRTSATKEVSSVSDLIAAFEDESVKEIKLTSNVDLNTAVNVDRKMTLALNGHTLSASNDTTGDGVFRVKDGGVLTINGNGTIDGVGKNDYNMAIWADGGKVIINGGTFTNIGAGSEDHYDLFYVKNGGIVEINGGYFEAETPKWTLNSHDTSKGTFIVRGGSFVGYNPAESHTENPVANFVANGYKSVESNGVWTVVKE